MKHRIKYIAVLAIVVLSFCFAGCTVPGPTTGNGGTTNPENTSSKLNAPTNLRLVEYAEDYILFFDLVDNADEYQINLYKGGSFYQRYVLSKDDAILGYLFSDLAVGKYEISVRAMVNATSKYLSSDSSDKLAFTIAEASDNTGGNNNQGGSDNTGGNNNQGGNDTPNTDYITYYDKAEGLTGAQLKAQLRTIISVVKKNTTYENLKTDLQYTDADPNNSSNILLFYSRVLEGF